MRRLKLGLKVLREDGPTSLFKKLLNQNNRPRTVDRVLFWMWQHNIISFERLYNDEYYQSLAKDGIPKHAHILANNIIETYNPSSAIELGAGVAQFPAALSQRGVQVHAVDNSKKAKENALIQRDAFTLQDLTKPFDAPDTYDVCLSIELLEHLPESAANTIVESMAGLAPVVITSAARPGQGGTHHVNEQPPKYWINKFAAYGLEHKPGRQEQVLSGVENEILADNVMVFEQTDLH